jgi:hypothetical protein
LLDDDDLSRSELYSHSATTLNNIYPQILLTHPR